MIMSTGTGIGATQLQRSVIRAAGFLPIITVTAQGGITGKVAPMHIGHVCGSPNRAAGKPTIAMPSINQ
jgi:hypothetical protein